MIDTLQDQRKKERIAVHAFVVMPDHVHLILTPAPEVSLEKAMQYIKGGFSFRLKGKVDVWQRSYDRRRILDPDDFVDRTRYVHQNPMRAHIVSQAELYAFSSAGRVQLIDLDSDSSQAITAYGSRKNVRPMTEGPGLKPASFGAAFVGLKPNANPKSQSAMRLAIGELKPHDHPKSLSTVQLAAA